MLRDYCYVNDNVDKNTFVGVHVTREDKRINFPLGYHLPIDLDDSATRKEILLLISVLAKNTDKEDSVIADGDSKSIVANTMPVQSYLYIIKDFLYSGYYKENEVVYCQSSKGKINWNRTVKSIRPMLQEKDAVYLDFITKKTTVNENDMLTLIHQYCVYESFMKIGWIFTSMLPSKPVLKLNAKMFNTVLRAKLANIFNDRLKVLIRNMLAVINNEDSSDESGEFRYGTYAFSAVWERMINRVYGVDNLKDYYPYTFWGGNKNEKNDDDYKNSSLRPDSVMLDPNNTSKVYVLDAKYYKYGNWPQQALLPKSADINKQITYGEYISEILHDGKDDVYNAFIMPFDANRDDWLKVKDEAEYTAEPSHLHWIGEATSIWKKNTKKYEHIQGILLDVKHLMQLNVSQDRNEMMELANLIEERCSVK